MICSSRLKKILQYCLHRDDYVTMEELAEMLKTSTRTIFREIKDIDSDLEQYGLRLSTKNKKGLRLVGSLEQKQLLQKELDTQNVQYIDKEERRNLLTFEMLRSQEMQKLIHYANMFQVSEGTISNDLDKIEPWLNNFSLTLSRRPGIGVEIKGNEADIRKALHEVLTYSLKGDGNYHNVNYLDSNMLLKQFFMSDDGQSIMHLLNQEIMERVLKVFQTYHHELKLDQYAQSSYIGLMIHLVIAIERILKHEEMEEQSAVIAMVQDEECFTQAKNMAGYLELEFDIEIPMVEIAFIALHIKGSKIANIQETSEDRQDIQELVQLMKQMLNSYDLKYRIYLLRDEELQRGLLTHMQPAMTRIHNHLPIHNPLKQQIMELYPDLFEQTKRACKFMEEQCQDVVSDDEIAFITMHIGASLERAKPSIHKKRTIMIGVACASGIGISALLSARIQKVFQQEVSIQTLSMEDVMHQNYADCELLVTTFHMEVDNLPLIEVSPLLSEADVVNIRKQLELCQQYNVYNRVEHEEISFLVKMQNIRTLCDEIIATLTHVNYMEAVPLQTSDSLIQMIANPYKEASTKVADALTKRENMGSVKMKDYHFVMFHAVCEAIAENCITIVYPSAPTFQGEYEGYQFAIALLTPLKQQRIAKDVMSFLSRSLVENERFYQSICTRNQTNINAHMEVLLQTYFQQYIQTGEEA